MKRVVNVKVLPWEPTDGSGKVCIHFFVKDEAGPFVEPSVTCLVDTDEGKRLSVAPARGRLACDSKRCVAPVVRGNVVTVTPRTDDPRAVTCPKCKASKEYIEAMKTPAASG